MKTCTQCGQTKNLEEFDLLGLSKPGKRRASCSPCARAKEAVYRGNRKADPVKFAAHRKIQKDRYRETLRGYFYLKLRGIRSGIIKGTRRAGLECTISTSELVDIWNSQGGKCALSGVPLEMSSGDGKTRKNSASFDRIRHTEGYVSGNVRLLTQQANSARGSWSDEELLEFCRAVISHNS